MKRSRRRITTGIPVEKEHKRIFDLVKSQGVQATCFFNNKGGVGKTTLVANLAAELALNFHAKVLVVDCDPQCNLTQYVLGDEEALEIYSRTDPLSVYSVIRPLSLGKGYGKELPIQKAESFGFDLIIGDPRLALQEDLLAQDWRDAKAGGMRGLRTTYVFADVVGKAKDLNYDFVFFDMGPSLGAINRSILLAMDFFVVPMAIDIFSIWAIKNIGTTVGVWQKELRTGISLSEDPSEIPSIDQSRHLKFLGYVTQQHKERGGSEPDIGSKDGINRKRIVQAYKDISEGFPTQITTNLGSFYDSKRINPHLGDIRHLGSLAPKSQSQHEPMISVRGTGSYTQLRKQAREIYRGIAVRYLENLLGSQGSLT
ncbi:ParA family protein [Azospirillum argentinense]|uniref:ParA family protein n=1 Tax=Azospirillum argentinense TaxID=2970906 RepID=A0A4D8PGY4_9PROT|nr:AAA family ATPase [Azospirillum argentinense]QCN94525.1 ParA family protein [Azospirillum argentinense]